MVGWCRFTLVLGCAVGIGPARSVNAQVEHRWSTDAAVGGASAKGGDFLSTGRAAADVSLAGQLVRHSRFAIYAEAGYQWFGQFGLLGADPDLTCVLSPRSGGCKPHFPDVTGPIASIGLVYAPSARVESRVGLGGAAYSVDGTRVGATIAQLDATVFPAAHVGLLLTGQFVTIPRYRHDRLTMVPVLVGLRVR